MKRKTTLSPFNFKNKRGQFFLLAAVIISAVIISLGTTTNKATVDEEPKDFYDLGDEMKRETGAILDYTIYKNITEETNLTKFVKILADEVKERNPGASFMFVYGNNESMLLKNYGPETIYMDGIEFKGEQKTKSRICFNQLCQEINPKLVNFEDGETDLKIKNNNLLIEIEGNKYNFPLTKHKQVIFVMQKNVGGNKYITVK